MGATRRKPLGREVENNLVKVRSYAHKILFMRLGAVAAPAVDGAFVQRHRLSSQWLLSRFQELPNVSVQITAFSATDELEPRFPVVSRVTD